MSVTRLNHFEAKPGGGAALETFLTSIIELVRASVGCRSVELLASLDSAEKFAIVEVWDSVEAHQAAASLVPAAKMQEVMTLLAGKPVGAYFRPVPDTGR